MDKLKLAGFIDHTALKPTTTTTEIKKLCAEAREFSFHTVCVNACYIKLCREELKGTAVKTITVVGFPLGATLTAAKVAETKLAIEAGAQEIDMVINVGALKSGDTILVKNDIAEIVKASGNVPVKVIIETCFLTDEEKVTACKLAKEAGAAFVKTSTGFGSGGATVDDIKLMRQTVGKEMGVKASGGIRTLADALVLIEAGASRLGTSNSVAIVSA